MFVDKWCFTNLQQFMPVTSQRGPFNTIEQTGPVEQMNMATWPPCLSTKVTPREMTQIVQTGTIEQ